MRVTFHNVYSRNSERPYVGLAKESAQEAAESKMRCTEPFQDRHLRVEMHIDGHWHRPPVGIKASECSHEWRIDYGRCSGCKPLPYLETRK